MIDIQNDGFGDEDFETVLSSDIEFSGFLSFGKPFMIRGKVSGTIDATSLLVVDEAAAVEADIGASQVVIRGSVKGNIVAREKLEITGAGKLTGDVTTSLIRLDSGCRFNGRCTMPDQNTTPTV
jgi:cytoskeletal protein CcmA (bactofilin family)